MVDLYSPNTEVELVLIKSIFDAEGIDYFIRNDHFGSMRIGVPIEGLNTKMIVVDDEHYDKAKELLQDYLEKSEKPDISESKTEPPKSLLDKIRIVFEFLLFGWFIPGSKSHKGKKQPPNPLY